jgi:hypothetical protein
VQIDLLSTLEIKLELSKQVVRSNILILLGTGILSMFAARAGAKRVIGVCLNLEFLINFSTDPNSRLNIQA